MAVIAGKIAGRGAIGLGGVLVLSFGLSVMKDSVETFEAKRGCFPDKSSVASMSTVAHMLPQMWPALMMATEDNGGCPPGFDRK